MSTDPGTVYLDHRPFDDPPYYSIAINGQGVTVYSECCADTMSVDTARAVHEALGRYLADVDAFHAT